MKLRVKFLGTKLAKRKEKYIAYLYTTVVPILNQVNHDLVIEIPIQFSVIQLKCINNKLGNGEFLPLPT